MGWQDEKPMKATAGDGGRKWPYKVNQKNGEKPMGWYAAAYGRAYVGTHDTPERSDVRSKEDFVYTAEETVKALPRPVAMNPGF